jgi:hypothetical protein
VISPVAIRCEQRLQLRNAERDPSRFIHREHRRWPASWYVSHSMVGLPSPAACMLTGITHRVRLLVNPQLVALRAARRSERWALPRYRPANESYSGPIPNLCTRGTRGGSRRNDRLTRRSHPAVRGSCGRVAPAVRGHGLRQPPGMLLAADRGVVGASAARPSRSLRDRLPPLFGDHHPVNRLLSATSLP